MTTGGGHPIHDETPEPPHGPSTPSGVSSSHRGDSGPDVADALRQLAGEFEAGKFDTVDVEHGMEPAEYTFGAGWRPQRGVTRITIKRKPDPESYGYEAPRDPDYQE